MGKAAVELAKEWRTDRYLRRLEAQLAVATYVVFSVPSVNWPREDFGDERRMTLEEWKNVLSGQGLDIEHAEYYQEDDKDILIFSLNILRYGPIEISAFFIIPPVGLFVSVLNTGKTEERLDDRGLLFLMWISWKWTPHTIYGVRLFCLDAVKICDI